MTMHDLPPPEFSRPVDLARVGDGHRRIDATEEERAALARRFGIVRIDRLEAELTVIVAGSGATVTGRFSADIVQSCAVSGNDLPVHIDEPLVIRFIPEAEHVADEEIELSDDECDEIEFTGTVIDLGEAVAQSLSLAIDPFATGPDADTVRQAAGLLDEQSAGPFAALAALKKGK